MEVRNAKLLTQAFRPGDLVPPRGPEVMLVGRSNVGKSSLINRLLGRRELAKVAKSPGKTRGAFFYSINEEKLIVVDLPGYGFAKGAREESQVWETLTAAIAQRPGPRLLLQLVDLRLPPQRIDLEAAAWFAERLEHRLLVGTKADKLPQGRLAQNRRALTEAFGIEPLATSAEKGDGLRLLWRTIDQFLAT